MVQVVVCFLIVAGQLGPVSSPQAHRTVAPRPFHPKLFHHAVDGRACLFVRVDGARVLEVLAGVFLEVDRVFGAIPPDLERAALVRRWRRFKLLFYQALQRSVAVCCADAPGVHDLLDVSFGKKRLVRRVQSQVGQT